MPTRTLTIEGMHCQGCGTIIEQAVQTLPGVDEAHADYAKGTLRVRFDRARIDPARIVHAIENAGYACPARRPTRPRLRALGRLLILLLALAGLVWLLTAGDSLAARWQLPDFEHGMSYGMLFAVGLLTGFHCIGMCGGFVLGYTAEATARTGRAPFWLHLLYGFGKVASYTLIGGGFGLLGAAVTFTPTMRGIAAAVAGGFLILFGVNMLGWFPSLHRVGLKMPGFLARFVSGERRKPHGPLFIGSLNGLMIACGPLQAMYVMAAGTGDFLEGAKLLLAFGLGTLPVMFGFGVLAGVVSGRLTQRLLKLSAVLVMALGLIMLNRGLVLTGSGYDFRSLAVLAAQRWTEVQGHFPQLESGVQVIRMTATAEGFQPDNFVFKAKLPVRWIIEGRELTECNRRIVVPALGLEFELHPGENIIEFTPPDAGVIAWSCGMGMLQGTFIVAPEF